MKAMLDIWSPSVPVLAVACLALWTGAANGQTKPTVSFEPIEGNTDANARTQWVKEESGTHNLKVTLNPAPTSPLTISYTVDGNANSGSDYAPLSGTLLVPAHATTATIPVTIIDDNESEGAEEIAVQINDPAVESAAYRVSRPYSHILIIDPSDRPPWVSFARESASADEGSGTHNVGVRLHPAPSSHFTLSYTVDGTATPGSDYTALSGTVAVARGATTATVPVTIIDDSAQEDSETVALTLVGGSGYRVESPGTHTLTILDDDDADAIVVSLARVGSGPIAEGVVGDTARFTVSLGRALAAGETVIAPLDFSPWAAPGQPGLQPSDFAVTLASGAGVRLAGPIQDCWVVFEAGAQVATLELAAVLDDVADDGERISVGLGAASRFDDAAHGHRTDVAGGAQPHATARGFETVLKDSPVTVRFDMPRNPRFGNSPGPEGGPVVVEEGEALTVSLSLSRPLPAPVTVHLSSLDEKTYYFYNEQAVAGVDYAAGPWTVTFAAGETRASIDIQTTEDADIEGPGLKWEGFDISLDRSRLPPDVRLSGPQVFTFLIEDDDMAIVAFTKERQTVQENAGTVLIPVTVERTLSTPFALEYMVSRRSNEDGRRWHRLGYEEVTVPANAATFDIPYTIVDDDVQEEDELIRFTLGFSAKALSVLRKDIFYLTITSDDGPPLLMSGIADAVVEHNSDWRAWPRVRNATGAVTWTLSGADASAFAIDAATGAVSLPVQDYGTPADADGDNVYEATVTATDADGRTVSTAFKVTVVAARLRFVGERDNVGINMVAYDVTEGEELTLTLELSQALSEPFTVTFKDSQHFRGVGVGYRATRGADYPVIPWSATFPAGATRATVSFPTNGDTDDKEPSEERLFLSMAGNSLPAGVFVRDESLVSDRVAHVRIHNVADRGPFVSFASTSSEVREDAGTVSLDVTVDPPPAAPFALHFSLSGTATPGDDYRIRDKPIEGATGNGGTVTVPANAGSVTVPVEILDDALDDDSETIVVSLLESAGYAAAAPDSVTLTIRDDDAPPAVATVDPALVAQVRGYAAETREGQAHVDRWRRVLAAFGDDNGHTPMTAAEAQTHADKGWQRWVPVVAALEALEAAPVPQRQPATLPAVSVSAGADVTEGGDAAFTVTANPAPASPLAVTVTVAADGDFGIAAGSQSVTIPTTGSATLTLATADDGADEADGSATVTVTAGDGYTVGSPASGSVSIADDDLPLPAIAVSAGDPVTEGGDATFTVTASPAPASPLAVSVTVAVDGDYGMAAGEQTVTIPTTGSATLTLTTANDEADETDGSVTATVNDGEGYTVGSPASGAVAIADDDPAPAVATVDPALVAQVRGYAAETREGQAHVDRWKRVLAAFGDDNGHTPMTAAEAQALADRGWQRWVPVVAALEALEAAPEPQRQVAALPAVSVSAGADVTEGGDAVFTVTASPAAGLSVTVTVAAAGEFGIAAGSQSVTIPTTGSATLTLATANDDADEPDGSVSVTVAAGNGYTVGSPASGSVSIADDDAPLPAIAVSAGDTVTEGGDATFTVTASPAPASPLAVSVTVAAEGDYGIASGTQTVSVPTTGSAVLTLATADDDADEADGAASVTVNDGDGYTVGDPASGTVAVRDDDEPPPAVTVSAGDAVAEGSDATFTVTASPAPASPLAVSVTVAARGDYGIASGTRTVSVPTTGSAVLTLTTADDDADEADGAASVTVNAGDGYTVGSPASGSVSIADDDLPPPAVSIAAKAASVTEGGDAAFALTADRAPDADLTVTLSVAETGDGDHVAAADEGPATAVIAKGATEAVFSVATVDDDADEPDGSVTVTLKDGEGYAVSPSPGNAAAVTVSDDDAAAVPALSVDDATGQENGRLPAMPFTVRLSAPARDAVRVYVSTRPSTPESATPKVDYEPGSYDLLFRAGETERQVWVMIHDDSHDEEPETFEVVLSRAQGAPIGDGVAVGTIENDDPMPAAWLARFGRAVAEQALDGIAGRMSADRAPGMRGSIAGQALSLDPAANADAAPAHAPDGAVVPGGTSALALAGVAQAFGGGSGRHGAGGPGHGAAGFGSEAQSRSMTAREALLGSSFSLTGATDGSGGSVALWGRTAHGGFDGREGSLSLDGTVTTGMLGADHARGKWLVGLALARSEGEGDYRDAGVDPRPASQTCPSDAEGGADAEPCRNAAGEGDGSVEGSLTAAVPYAALRASERLRLWGAVGHGTGDVTLRTAMGGSYRSDTAWSMAAAGLRGGLLALPAGGSGPALAVTSDALWTRTSSGRTRQLAASESDATRLRLGLEGSYRMALGGGGSLVPKLEVGARHDGGDAETGFGVELGGGIAWSDPALGLSLDVSGRALVAHGNDDLKDRGCAASLAFDPDPATGRGPSLSLRQEFGGRAQGGLDALFQPATLEDRAGGGEASSRWALEAAYGLPAFGGRFTGSPHAGLGFATGARDYSVGWRLARETESAANVSFGVRATRRESDAAAPEHTVGVEMTARW